MMKLQLTAEAHETVKRISPKIRAANRYCSKSTSALVSAMMVEFEPLMTPAVLAALAERLVSRAGRRKALLAAMARVAQTADEKQLRKLENQLQRLQEDQGDAGASKAEPRKTPDSTDREESS